MHWKIGDKPSIESCRDGLVVAIDLSFSTSATTGLAWAEDVEAEPSSRLVTFSDAASEAAKLLGDGGALVVEAPLSARFDAAGNPRYRGDFERFKRPGQNTQTRYWYSGSGASTCLAAHFFLTNLSKAIGQGSSDITLFEGFLSFKVRPKKGRKASDHVADALDLVEAFRGNEPAHLYDVELEAGDSILGLPGLLDLVDDPSAAPCIIEPARHRS